MLYNYLMDENAAKERLQHLIDEATEERRARKFARANGKRGMVAQLGALISNVSSTVTRVLNTETRKTSDQPVNNSL